MMLSSSLRPLAVLSLTGALIVSALPASAVQDSGAAIGSFSLGPLSTMDNSTVSTSSEPLIAATQDYRQFPYVWSVPSGKGTANTPKTLLMSYNVNMDSGAFAEKIRTKRSTDGGLTWIDLPQAVPMTSTVRTKTGLLYSVNFRTSTTGSTPPSPIPITASPVLEKPGVGGNDTKPDPAEATAPDGTKPTTPTDSDPHTSYTDFTTRYWTSTDTGSTWRTATGSVHVPWPLQDLYFHRSILIAPDGHWIATAYGRHPDTTRWTSLILTSNDEGHTWQGLSEIGQSLITWGEGVTEPTITFNSRGQLIAAYRQQGYIDPSVCQGSARGNAPVATAVSDDLGATWTNAKFINLPKTTTGSSAPQLQLAPTGQLLLSVGRPFNRVLISDDGTGDRWDRSIDTAKIISSGYTSLVDTGTTGQYRQYGDLGSNWCYTPDTAPTRTAGIYSIPLALRPTDANVLDLGTGLQTGTMSILSNTMTHTLTSNTTAQGLADGLTEPDTGLTAPGNQGTFTLDLGNTYLLRAAGLAMPTAGASATMEFSPDAHTWTPAATWQPSDRYRTLTDRTTPTTRTRYIRVTTTANTQALISEMRLYTTLKTFESDLPGQPPGDVTTVGTSTGSSATVNLGQGYQSTRGVRIIDNSPTAMPRFATNTPAQSTTFTGFRFNPSSIKTAMTITQNTKLPNGKIARGAHLGLFPDGSVRRYTGTRWNTIAPAGTVRKGTWSHISIYSNATATEFTINGHKYTGQPRTTPGGKFIGTTISSGGTATTGDNVLIDDLDQH